MKYFQYNMSLKVRYTELHPVYPIFPVRLRMFSVIAEYKIRVNQHHMTLVFPTSNDQVNSENIWLNRSKVGVKNRKRRAFYLHV